MNHSTILIEKNQFRAICKKAGKPFEQALACVQSETAVGYYVLLGHKDFPLNQARGWGDHVADGLAAVGITKERVSKLVGKDCGCAKRQAALNAIGKRVTDYLKGANAQKLDDQTG